MDGSWSIGRLNFKTIRNFIARTVSVFDIGPDRVQIGKFLQVDQRPTPNGTRLRSLSPQVWLSTAETRRRSGT